MIRTDRSLPMYIILSLVTCNIYSYWFLYHLAQDVNTMCAGDGDQTPGLVEFIVFSFISCGFYALWWYYKLGNRLQANAPRYGLAFEENGTTILLWYLVGMIACGLGPFVAMYLIIKNTNAMAIKYNEGTGTPNATV